MEIKRKLKLTDGNNIDKIKKNSEMAKYVMEEMGI